MTSPVYENTWEENYLDETMGCLTLGHERKVRNGKTKAKFHTVLKYDLSAGFPLLTTKFVPFDIVFAELRWFIEGGLKPNADRGEIYGRMSTHRLSEIAGREVKIWNGDTDNFAKLGKAKFDGDCGRIYGAQWRDFSSYVEIDENRNGQKIYVRKPIDQLQNLIDKLKSDPFGRYSRVTAWNPAELGDMSLPACHATFQCFVSPDQNGDMRLDMHMEQRSCDMFLGVPFNIASYALLTHMLAQVSGYKVGTLIMTLLDHHVYVTDGASHADQVKEQCKRIPYKIPQLKLNPEIKSIDEFTMRDIELIGYRHHPKLIGALSTAVIK